MSRTRNCLVTGAIWVGVSLAPIALLSSEVSAQQTADASPELVQAILRHAYRFDGGNVRLVDGRVPEDLADFKVPPGTRVLGSVVYGSSVRVFATTRSPLDSLREFYTRTLAPAGWKPLSRGTGGGFITARRDIPVMFCRDGAQLQIQRQPGSGGAADLVFDYRDGMGPCDQAMGISSGAASWSSATSSSSGRAMALEGPRFPTLYSPDDASASSSARCFPRGGSYRGSMGTGTSVATAMTAPELLRHYARQLEGEGWRPAAGGREAAVGTWTLADSTGVRDLTLQVVETTRPAPACFEVQMRMSERPR